MKTTMMATACLTMFLTIVPAQGAVGDKCKNINGKATWTFIPAPNEPFGRILGPSSGELNAATSAYITSVVPQPDGTLKVTSVDVWVVGPQDLLIFSGVATYTQIAGEPAGTIQESLTLTVTGGTGAFAGASGTIEVSGTGLNIFGPTAGPGSSVFDVRYSGSVCSAH